MKIYNFINNENNIKLEILIKENNIFNNLFNKEKLTEIKSKIDNYENKKWNQSKKSVHIYEYIYTSSHQVKNISNIIPISRSYFKLYEILKDIEINLDNKTICCICEGPGGFIHCINDNKLIPFI